MQAKVPSAAGPATSRKAASPERAAQAGITACTRESASASARA